LPGLFADETPAEPEPLRAPAAEWLVARSSGMSAHAGSWREWLLARTSVPADVLERFPAGPCVRAMQSLSVPTGAWPSAPPKPAGTWACARPVHLLTAIDHLQIGTSPVVLEDGERATLARDLNAHFVDRRFVFHAEGTGADWTLECPSHLECTSVEPEGLSGRNLRDLMPAGKDAATARSLVNEIQMLLHEHPVNAARVARSLPVVNSLWLWGFGQAGKPEQTQLPALFTDDVWLEGLWRMHGAAAAGLAGFAADSSRTEGDVLVAWSRRPELPASDALEEAERCLFEPTQAALRSGAVDHLDMLLGERTFAMDPGARLRFWRRGRPLETALA
jgi:hypothetical protein